MKLSFDDRRIDACIWDAIQNSTNLDDFHTYIAHQPENAAHLEAAFAKIVELGSASSGQVCFGSAVAEIVLLAQAGNATARFHVGKCYALGHGVPQDMNTAAHWYGLAVSNGEVRAMNNLGKMKLFGQGIETDVTTGIELLEQAIGSGAALSAEALGHYYLGSQDDDRIPKALHCFRRGFAMGSRSCGMSLGKLLYDESNCDAESEDAKSILKGLADDNYHPAMRGLGYIFTEGRRRDRNIPAARELFLRLLEAGDNEAMISLGLLDIKTPPPQGESAQSDRLEWFRRAWAKGVSSAAGYLGRCLFEGDGAPKSIEMAHHWFSLGAECGEDGCAYFLGHIAESGLLKEPDDIEAERWFRVGAEKGIAISQVALAKIYLRDRGIRFDSSQAINWLTSAIEQGRTDAMLLLADVYQQGKDVIPNQQAAFELCLKAAKAGNVIGQSEVGWRYVRGLGCEIDLNEGISWHTKAAESGRAFDQGILASIYLYGQGDIECDPDQAVKWARLSAAQGDGIGQRILGECYLFGQGLTKDRALAIEWLRKAADQGNVQAQARLAETYYTEDGHGHRNFFEAGRWASLAAEAGHSTAQIILGRLFLFGEWDPLESTCRHASLSIL